MTNQTTFVPSASVSFNTPAVAPAVFTLPAIDSANTDTLIKNNGSDAIYLSVGLGAVAGPQVANCLMIPGNGQVLLTTNATTLAGPTQGGVIGNPQAGAAANTTSVTAMSGIPSQSITISRGTATLHAVF